MSMIKFNKNIIKYGCVVLFVIVLLSLIITSFLFPNIKFKKVYGDNVKVKDMYEYSSANYITKEIFGSLMSKTYYVAVPKESTVVSVTKDKINMTNNYIKTLITEGTVSETDKVLYQRLYNLYKKEDNKISISKANLDQITPGTFGLIIKILGKDYYKEIFMVEIKEDKDVYFPIEYSLDNMSFSDKCIEDIVSNIDVVNSKNQNFHCDNNGACILDILDNKLILNYDKDYYTEYEDFRSNFAVKLVGKNKESVYAKIYYSSADNIAFENINKTVKNRPYMLTSTININDKYINKHISTYDGDDNGNQIEYIVYVNSHLALYIDIATDNDNHDEILSEFLNFDYVEK